MSQIKGKQIKDDTITGDDVNEDSLLIKYFTFHKYTSTSTNFRYLRFVGAGSGDLNSTMANNKAIAPAGGQLKYIIFRCNGHDGSPPGDVAISFTKLINGQGSWKSGTDGNGDPIERPVVQTVVENVSSLNTSVQFNFTSSSFSRGEVLGLKVDPTGGVGDADLVCVWEFDWSS